MLVIKIWLNPTYTKTYISIHTPPQRIWNKRLRYLLIIILCLDTSKHDGELIHMPCNLHISHINYNNSFSHATTGTVYKLYKYTEFCSYILQGVSKKVVLSCLKKNF